MDIIYVLPWAADETNSLPYTRWKRAWLSVAPGKFLGEHQSKSKDNGEIMTMAFQCKKKDFIEFLNSYEVKLDKVINGIYFVFTKKV